MQTFDLRSLVSTYGTGSTRSGSSGSGSTGSTTAGGTSTAGYGGAARGGGGLFGIGGGRAGGLSAFYPVIAGGIIVIAAIVLYIKRKWIRAKFRKQ